MPRRPSRRARLGAALLAAVVGALAASGAAAPASAAPPPAPAPTSTEASPGAPDPAPPLGGRDAEGRPVGGSTLLRRDLIVPAGAAPLPENLTATSWILADLDTGDVLAARDPHGRYQPASILKVLTCLVLLPQLPGDRRVVVSPSAAAAEGSAVGLVPGGSYTVDDLFSGLLMMSGNDTAVALAEAAGGVEKTVAQMNELAGELGMHDTFVQTPSGLDGWSQLTSAYDMALVLREAVSDARFLRLDSQLIGALPAQKVGDRDVGPVPLGNQGASFLTDVPGALMAKSGFTDAALSTYMAASQRNGRRLGVVFLRNQRFPLDQWQQAALLMDWGYALPAAAAPVGQLAPSSVVRTTEAAPIPAATPTAASEGSAPSASQASGAPAGSPGAADAGSLPSATGDGGAAAALRGAPLAAYLLALSAMAVAGLSATTLRRALALGSAAQASASQPTACRAGPPRSQPPRSQPPRSQPPRSHVIHGNMVRTPPPSRRTVGR